ncbi:MAG: hypothetical protein Q4P22_06730 [Eubacteriales bacterium]|nr:hypothetical protein [Eubacteriales bacterium]
MRYLYKQTGIVVESDITLDSAMFRPVNEEPEVKEEVGEGAEVETEPEISEDAEKKAEPEVKPKAVPAAKAKTTARKTATAKK